MVYNPIMTNPAYLLTISSILELIGAILIALVVWGVHSRIIKEHRIDEVVLKSMRREKAFVYAGITFLILSFLLEIFVRLSYGISL